MVLISVSSVWAYYILQFCPFSRVTDLITCVKHLSIVSSIQSPDNQTDEDEEESEESEEEEESVSDNSTLCDSGVECDDCQECSYRRQLAGLDSLPLPVIQGNNNWLSIPLFTLCTRISRAPGYEGFAT